MSKYSRFTGRASLAAMGLYMRELKIWQVVREQVEIKQKVIEHEPLDKVLDEFINMLAGGAGVVEINTRVRSDEAVQRAFGRAGCAEQSTVSQTFNACTEETVEQMRQAVQEVYRRYGQGYAHDYERGWQVLDVDITGLPGGVQGEGVTKGYFRHQKRRRGRQVGRVLASNYDEVVVDRLYPGNVQLEKSLQELVQASEEVLVLTPERRKRTIIRVDGGGGRDADLNWLLEREYRVVAKVKNWQRTKKLAQSVQQWYPDPKVPERQVGWIREPHEYARPTRQIAIRKPKKDGSWQYRVLVFNLSNFQLALLTNQPQQKQDQDRQLLFNATYVYDQRGGGVETSIRNSKQGLLITKRTKHLFAAQEMLLLLAQLAYLLLVWLHHHLAVCEPRLARFGTLRMVRDILSIPGLLQWDAQGRVLRIAFNQSHCWAAPVCYLFSLLFPGNDLHFVLDEI